LTRVLGSTDTHYNYDPFGRRIEKIVNTGTPVMTRYVYDGPNIVTEYDGSWTATAKYIHTPDIDEPLTVTQGENTFYYHLDGLGSVVNLTDASGYVAKTYTYKSFGESNSQPGGLVQPFTFTDREFDPESGLYFYRARYYDPRAGRFLTRDPIGFAGGDVNLYRVTGNDPLNYVDPIGLLRFKAFNQVVDLKLSATFLPINIGWDLTGLSLENLFFNAIMPPLSAGFGLEVNINPPSTCEKYVTPYVGFGKNLSIGTNAIIISNEPLKLRWQGINVNLGISGGLPIGVQVPDAFSPKKGK
jgi:RHS repeat-associated protein